MSWWKNYKDEFILMLEYIESIKIRKDLDSFFKDYRTETMIRMVFESNTIENEGIKYSNTRSMFYTHLQPSFKILEEKSLDQENKENQVYFKCATEILKNLTENLNIINLGEKYLISNKFNLKSLEVTLNHLILISAIDALFKFKKNNIQDLNTFFDSKNIKDFHRIISKNLQNNNNGNPGEYRVDGAWIDEDIVFLQASLISEAIEKALEVFLQNLNNKKNMYLENILFVAKFIRIHPFGDFNGRLSRIILNLVFLYDDIPFYLILRSNSRDKKKYIESMKEFYQKKRISKFISVVSRSFIKQIEEINDSLELADKELIKPLTLSNESKEKIKIELEEF